MNKPSDLRILFPTSFSDACFRTSRAIAQLADICGISLTIAHVAPPGSTTIGTRRELNSFLAEADHYDDCSRILVESDDPVEAIGDICDGGSFDLVIAPASDRFGLQRLFTTSFRARLLKRCKTPVWTVGNCLDRLVFKPSLQTVACVLDFDCPTDNHLRLAAAVASRTGARMRIVAVIPPISEGTLIRSIHSRTPLMPDVAREEIRAAFVGRACPEVDVAVGEIAKQLPRMLARCEADIAFIGPGQALDDLWIPRLTSYVDKLPCPVVCVDGASARFEGWTFQNNAPRADTRALVHVKQAVAN